MLLANVLREKGYGTILVDVHPTEVSSCMSYAGSSLNRVDIKLCSIGQGIHIPQSMYSHREFSQLSSLFSFSFDVLVFRPDIG